MRRTHKDHSDIPKNKLPKIPKLDLILYHWSPTTNRVSINHNGLMINKLSLQGQWRPPYIALADDPWLAWYLSGRLWPKIKNWDLWMCHFPSQTSFDHYECITDTFKDTGRYYIKEYRVYTRIFKRDLTYLATRTQ